MALVKCKECGNEISSKADKCPHCGVIFFDVPSKNQYKLKLSGGNLSSEYAYVTID